MISRSARRLLISGPEVLLAAGCHPGNVSADDSRFCLDANYAIPSQREG